MGYSVTKSRAQWRLIHEHWENGERRRRHVKRAEWKGLGLEGCKTIEEARAIVKHLNAKERVREQERRRNRIEARRRQEDLIECAHLPSALIVEFEREVLAAKRLREPHWAEAKRAIRAVKAQPADWYFKPHPFYDYFRERGHSPDYCGRILRMINEWGRFYCRRINSFWQDVPKPRGKFLNEIRRAYEAKTGGGRYRARLSFELLESKKAHLSRAEYAWLFISVAFGLRPEEINHSLRTEGRWGVREDALFVYQPKLERTESNPKRRWKRIDMKLPEQRTALKMIMAGEFKAPTRKKLKTLFGPKATLYGGRKEFFPRMRKLFDPLTVARWMGHTTLETARRHYDDPEDDFPFDELAVSGGAK